ncbi:hypothetical protein BC629DRAFT_1442029 [Irpex lacteus]|nr:hypothetical protein BC629DRAFT_1442029 [Irpex lacteus]
MLAAVTVQKEESRLQRSRDLDSTLPRGIEPSVEDSHQAAGCMKSQTGRADPSQNNSGHRSMIMLQSYQRYFIQLIARVAEREGKKFRKRTRLEESWEGYAFDDALNEKMLACVHRAARLPAGKERQARFADGNRVISKQPETIATFAREGMVIEWSEARIPLPNISSRR